jgi:thioesterase domain-containing protein
MRLLWGAATPAQRAELTALAAADDVDALVAMATQQALVPAEADPQALRRQLRTVNRIEDALQRHVDTPLALGATLFAATANASPPGPRGWDALLAGGVQVVPVPGDHQSIVEAPQVRTLAAALDAALTRAEARTV